LILGENETVSIKNCVSKIEAILNQISIQSFDSQIFKSIDSLHLFLDSNNINSFSRIDLSKAMDDFQIKNNALDQAIFEQYFVFKPTHFGLNGGEQ
jgi:A predicted alpha-helical domain with a conserved ER motif.